MKLPSEKIFLAPMEEVNDPAFRMLCKKTGALTYTGMTHPMTQKKQILEDKPILQLFCKTPEGTKEFMKRYDKEVSGWDLNLGCPAKNAKKHGFGSFLKDLKIIEEIIKTMRENTKKPLSIKFRKADYSFELLEIAEKYCNWICIHPRTQAQGYSGKADLDFALKIKDYSSIPVIYSGDVNEKNIKELLKNFDYIMIGRAAIGNPNIFSKLNNKKEVTFKDYLKLAEKYKLPFRQVKFQAVNFTKGLRDSTKTRVELCKCKNLDELKKIYRY